MSGAPPENAAMTKTDPVFDDDYTGPRWTYGLVNRPMQIGAQPKGYIVGSERRSVEFKNFGTVQYPRQLTDEEIAGYELKPVMVHDAAHPNRETVLALSLGAVLERDARVKIQHGGTLVSSGDNAVIVAVSHALQRFGRWVFGRNVAEDRVVWECDETDGSVRKPERD